MIKAVFFDIDGTLISFNTHRMPDSTRKALLELRRKDIKLFIATGRGPTSLSDIEHILDFKFDGYVMLNGQYGIVQNKVIHELSLPVVSLEAVIPYLEKENISCEFVEIDHSYLNSVNDKVLELQKVLGSTVKLPPVNNTDRIYTSKTYQLCAYISENEEKDFFNHMPGCRAVRWNPLFIDVIPEEGGKSVGIQKILNHFGFSQEECMAFGDGGNDIEMLQFAKIGVAMGNATSDVKETADYITADIDCNGISSALLKYNLI